MDFLYILIFIFKYLQRMAKPNYESLVDILELQTECVNLNNNALESFL